MIHPTYIDTLPSSTEYLALNSIFQCAVRQDREPTPEERDIALRYIMRLRRAMSLRGTDL